MRKVGFLTIFFLHLSLRMTVAQSTRLSLRPYLGLQMGSNYVVDNTRSSSTFKSSPYNETLDLGLLLEAQLNEEYKITGGIASGAATIGYSLTIPNSKNPYGSPKKIRNITASVIRFPVFFSWLSSTKKAIPIRHNRTKQQFRLNEQDQEDQHYLFVFRLEPFIGASYNHLIVQGEGLLGGTTIYNFGDTISIDNERTTVKSTSGFSIIAGVTIQFLHQQNQRLAVTFYYNKGLTTLLHRSLDYSLNGANYQTILGSRGTTIGLNISYPIRLYDSFRQKKLYRER